MMIIYYYNVTGVIKLCYLLNFSLLKSIMCLIVSSHELLNANKLWCIIVIMCTFASF
jgi:hypothetical protein